MVVDDSVTVIIPDSEDDGEEETLIFCPYGDINVEVDAIPPVQRSSLGFEVPDGNEVLPPKYSRRFLRRRKAIQRMPYSLERIKHRQLLHGYDVSGFESISEEISLPPSNPNLSKTHQDSLLDSTRRRDENDDYQYGDDVSLEASISDDSPVTNDEMNEIGEAQHEDEIVSEDNKEKEEELLKFRGRLINMKTGFRGVLPKVAWEKSLRQRNPSNRNLKRKRDVSSNRRGVAKKKNITTERNANQDDSLLDDLVVPDDDVSLDEQQNMPTVPLEKPSNEDLHKLKCIDLQYKEKYGQQYPSDSDNEMEEADQLNNFIIELNGDQEKNRVEIFPLFALTPQDSFNQYDNETDLAEVGAVENREGVIDRMLSKGLHGRHQRNRSHSMNVLQYGFSKKSKKKLMQKRRSIRKPKPNLQNPLEQRSRLSSEFLHSEGSSKDPMSQMKSTFIEKNNDKMQKKGQKPIIGPFAPIGTEGTRRINVFSTVMEAPSDKYAFPKHRVPKSGDSNLDALHSTNDHIAEEAHLSALDSLLEGKQITPPDTVSVNLLNRQFILSRYHRNDVPWVLDRIFAHVIDHGVTDKAILEISENVTSFLLHFNHLGVLPKIVEFHKRFRSKVNQLRERAKSIHFYQIAVCQLMLLEVSKYSDISGASQTTLTFDILNHIVSFFKLLSYCSCAIVESNSSYLFGSLDILSKIAQMLEQEVLWKKLQEESFPPDICFFIVDIFPTKHPRWEILKIEQEYNSVRDAFMFVKYCKRRFNWQINQTLMFHFDKIFKRRRYEDFANERALTPETILRPSQGLVSDTVFNDYLKLLQEMQVSYLVVERITPMGELSPDDSLSALTNRINLLMVLAGISHVNLEKRMEDLIKPLLTFEYLSKKDHQFLRRSGQLVLDGILYLANINRIKNLTFRGKIIVMIFKNLLFEYAEIPGEVWTNFLDRLFPIIEESSKSKLAFCKEFYPCLILMSQKDLFIKNLVQALQFYLKNLSILGVTWVQGNILQIIKSRVCISTNWIDYYCTVGKFLIQENVMSWWSFYMYNDVRSSLTNKFYFDCKVLQMCDNESFELVKKIMFKTAANSILHISSTWFRHFLIQLMKKEYPAIIHHNRNESNSSLSLIKRFLWIVNRLSYNDILLQFISDLQKCHQQETLDAVFVTDIVEYLNVKFIDNVKDSHDFFSLKRELGISDAEAEKSAFRDAFRSQKDPISQACFLEWGLIHAHSNEEEMKRYMEKLESLFSFSVPEGSFRFFVRLISVHLRGDFLNFKRRLLIYLLYLINEVLNRRYLQISTNEFVELCILHKITCSHNDVMNNAIVDGDPNDQKILRTECLRLQFNVLRIADGFLEFELLAQMSRRFLSGSPWSDQAPQGELFDADLSNEIENIFRYNNLTSQLHRLYLLYDSDEKKLISEISELIMDSPLQ